MNRLGAAVALAAAGLLVLSACSSGKTPAAPTPSAPSPSRSSTAAEPSASPSIQPVASFHIGPFTQYFGSPVPSNPAQAKVVESFQQAQVLWTGSLVAGHPERLLRQYVTGAAYRHFLMALGYLNSQALEPSGSDLMFDVRVVALTSQMATVTTCDYDALAGSQYRSTGQVDPATTPPASQAYIAETWHLVPTAGHWAISAFSVALPPATAADQCQR